MREGGRKREDKVREGGGGIGEEGEGGGIR